MIFTKILFIAMISASCNGQQNINNQPKHNKEIFEQEKAETTTDKEGADIGYKNLKLIGELTKKYVKNTNEKDLQNSGCNGWVFDKTDLEGLLKSMRKVEPVEWNALCYNFPCYYEGRVANEKKQYTITINGASYVVLENKQETLYFILKTKSDKFITPCNCCE